MAKKVSLYSDRSVSGDAATNVGLVRVDFQSLSEVTPDTYGVIEVQAKNGGSAGPGAAVDIVLKVAVSDAELASAEAPSVLANAVVATLSCRLANNTTAKLRWRSSFFPLTSRFVYVWFDNDAFAANSSTKLSADLLIDDRFGKFVSPAAGEVTSVAGRTGAVTLTAADITDLDTGAVLSVAGRAGEVILEVADISDIATAGVTSVAARHGDVTLELADISDAGTAAAAAVADFTAAPVAAPAAANSTGAAGTWAYDATHIYVCIATDTWVRADLATW